MFLPSWLNIEVFSLPTFGQHGQPRRAKKKWVRTNTSKYNKIRQKAEIYTKIDRSQRITPISHSLGYPRRGYEKLDRCIPTGVGYIHTTKNDRGSARMCGSSISLYLNFDFISLAQYSDKGFPVDQMKNTRIPCLTEAAPNTGKPFNYPLQCPTESSLKLLNLEERWVLMISVNWNDHSSKRRDVHTGHFLFPAFWWFLSFPFHLGCQCSV